MLGVDHDGVFASDVVVPATTVFALPDALDDRAGAFVEPVAAALALRDAQLPLDAEGLIVGGGRMAELSRRILQSLGARRMRIHDPASPIGNAPIDNGPIDSGRYAWVVETVPSAEALSCAIGAARRDGVVVLKSRPCRPLALDVAQAVRKRLTLRALDYAPFAAAVSWLLENPVTDLFAEPSALEDFEAAFRLARADESRKVFLSVRGVWDRRHCESRARARA
jgi:threonine dehydrogenase-like Zn-dependent dehydrogenase